jgi:hypothetical protein
MIKGQKIRLNWALIPILATSGMLLGFGGKAAVGLWNYFELREHTQAEIHSWQIEEKNSSKFLIAAGYTFSREGKVYQARTLFKEPAFLNRLSAEDELKSWKNYRWAAWFNPSKPENSSLQKLFPYKDAAYGLISLGVFLYFLLFTPLYRQTFSRASLKKIL